MGLCVCTCITCPIGMCIGCGTAGCAGCVAENNNTPMPSLAADNNNQALYRQKIWGIQLYQIVVGIFLLCFSCLYIPLVTLCSRSTSSTRWSIYPGDGDCWSEGSPEYVNLGWWTGIVLGTTSMWLLCVLFSFIMDQRATAAPAAGASVLLDDNGAANENQGIGFV